MHYLGFNSFRDTISLYLKSTNSHSFIFSDLKRYFLLVVAFWVLFLQLPNGCNGQETFLGDSVENQIQKKEFKGSIRSNGFQPSKSKFYEKKFSKKRFSFKDWDKHFSNLGQKKFTSRKKISQSFDKLFKKNIKGMPYVSRQISEWDKHLADIKKNARIELSKEAQLLSVRETYNLMLQDMGYFQELAEAMDLRSINRYQFRRNRPEGPIPVDKSGTHNPVLN